MATLWEKHYDEGVPKNFEYPDYPSNVFNKWAEEHPENPIF